MIGPMMLRQPDIARAVENTVTSQPRLAGPPFALPGQTLPGAERRLRNILEQQAESSPDPLGRGGLLWTGPDGSSIHTSQEGWRISGPPDRARGGPRMGPLPLGGKRGGAARAERPPRTRVETPNTSPDTRKGERNGQKIRV